MAKPQVTKYQLSKIGCNEIMVQLYTKEGRKRRGTSTSKSFVKVGKIKKGGNAIYWKELFNDKAKLMTTQELINLVNYMMAYCDAEKTPYVVTILENQAWKKTYIANWVWGNDARTKIKFKPRFRTSDILWNSFRSEW